MKEKLTLNRKEQNGLIVEELRQGITGCIRVAIEESIGLYVDVAPCTKNMDNVRLRFQRGMYR